jgi:hypothetical protein
MYQVLKRLVGVSNTSHAAHHTENVVVNSVHSDLGSSNTRHGRRRENKLKNSVINSREVAASRRLVLLRAKGEGVHVDTSIRGTGVVLVRLDNVKVRSLTLRESVLAVKLELSGDDRVLTPAVHVEGSLGEHECSGIGETRCGVDGSLISRSERSLGGGSEPSSIGRSGCHIDGTRHLEETLRGDEGVGARSLGRSTERMDGVRKGIKRVGVVERLSTKNLEKGLGSIKRRAVVNVGIRLNHPHKLLHRVVEVELDLVGRRSNRLVTCELNLLN